MRIGYSLLLLLVLAVIGMGAYLRSTVLAILPNSTIFTSNISTSTVSTTTALSTTIGAMSPTGVKHVIVIMLENKDLTDVVGSPYAQYINQMLIPNYSIAEKYYALGHPSLVNYIALTSGTTDYASYSVDSLQGRNLVDLLSARNITWKAYMESMPTNSSKPSCMSGLSDTEDFYLYAERHNPFVYYTDIVDNETRCNQVVPLTQFYSDLSSNQLPQFSFITPNMINDGHYPPLNATACPAPNATVPEKKMWCADYWLSGFLPQIMNNEQFSNTIVFITWDESAQDPRNNVLLIVVSPYAKKGFVENTTLYTHYSVLATVEQIYSLGSLGRNDTIANVTGDLFVNDLLP